MKKGLDIKLYFIYKLEIYKISSSDSNSEKYYLSVNI